MFTIPTVHLTYDEAMVREATDNLETGISVGGRIITTIRHVDDKAVVANCQKGLQQLMDNLNKITSFGMKINVKKTEMIQKGVRRIQIVHDLANTGGYVELKQAAEDREGWRHRERMSRTFCTAEDY